MGRITNNYSILYKKVFVLHIKSNDEYVLTYNVDQGNVSEIPDNTILVHRKKETNTLYTINALNEAIRKANNGILDKKFALEWSEYRNSLLLTNDQGLNVVRTKLYKIINV